MKPMKPEWQEILDKFNGDWSPVAVLEELPQDFIWEYVEELGGAAKISASQKLSEEFILEYYDEINWLGVFKLSKLSEEFLRRADILEKINSGGYALYINHWSLLSRFQAVSENFIRDFQHKLDWACIACYQKMSKGFIQEFSENLEPHMGTYFLKNPYVEPRAKIKYMKMNGLIERENPDKHIIGDPPSSVVRRNRNRESKLDYIEQLKRLID